MPIYTAAQDDIKRRIRSLKKLELKIRFCHLGSEERKRLLSGSSERSKLVWDDFFNLRQDSAKDTSHYTLDKLVSLNHDELNDIINEYFWHVYYRHYRENGILDAQTFDPSILARFGLSSNADNDTIKKKFRDLAKKYHPDAGGDHDAFINFMENFKQLRSD